MMKQRRRMLLNAKVPTYYISGEVWYFNNRPVLNAVVTLTGTNFKGEKVSLETKSGYQGTFTFTGLLYGEYEATVSTVGCNIKNYSGLVREG